MSNPATPVADSIVQFLATATSRQLPENVVDAVRMCLVDWAGVALGAAGQPPGIAVRQALLDTGPAIVVSGGTASAPVAALINGTLAHTLDFDDTHVPSLSHISGPTWAALLAVVSTPGLQGADLLRAFAAGFEVGARLGTRLGPALLERRIHATAVIGTLAATAACAALLGLDETKTANAMGLAATQTGGLTVSFGTMAKPFHAGKSALNAVIAAQLARVGFTAAANAFDDEEGLARAVVQDRSMAFSPICGVEWQILQNTFKPYASCLLTHASIDCARHLRAEIGDRHISRIVARVHPLAIELAGKLRPVSALEGKFSLPFCVALALSGYSVVAADFTAERLEDEFVTSLMERVFLEGDATQRETGARISVTLADGGKLDSAVEYALGNPENPMLWSDMQTKFMGLASGRLGDRAAPLFARLRAIETVDDAAGLGFDP